MSPSGSRLGWLLAITAVLGPAHATPQDDPAWAGAPDAQAEVARLEARVHADPTDQATAWSLGHLYSRLDRDDDARRVFEACEERFGATSYDELMLGVLAERGLRFDAARARYEHAVALASDPTSADQARANLAALDEQLVDLARFARARERLTAAAWTVLALGAAAFLLLWWWWGRGPREPRLQHTGP